MTKATVDLHQLKQRVESSFALPPESLGAEARSVVDSFLSALERGQIRAAEPTPDGWTVNSWVKQGILLAFRVGRLAELPPAGPMCFLDKDTLPLRRFSLGDGVRIVCGGTGIRRGAFIAPGVVVMPPAYVNVGAYVDEGTMVDSHALVATCAQVGKRVHLSAGAMLGGVLEPIGAMPVIVEDEALIGGNCGVYEGAIIGRRVVLGSGVILTGSVTVYDLVRQETYRRKGKEPLRIPEGAVVVPGSRRLTGAFAERNGLSLSAPVIVKYRDEKTDAAVALEEALR